MGCTSPISGFFDNKQNTGGDRIFLLFFAFFSFLLSFPILSPSPHITQEENMIPIQCTICGKHCKVKTIRMERGEVNPETFRCQECNRKRHYTVAHPDNSLQYKLKAYAKIYQRHHR